MDIVAFRRGEKLLEAGRPREALEVFKSIVVTDPESDGAKLLQHMGICHRMLGELGAADEAFESALSLCGDDTVLAATILRNWSMVSLAKKDYSKAHEQLEGSLALLLQARDRVEYAASLGFRGRVFAREGETGDALEDYRAAHAVLMETTNDERFPTYALNNIVWWLKVERGLRLRFRLSIQAWQLADKALNRKRQVQIALLLVCRPLTNRVFRH